MLLTVTQIVEIFLVRSTKNTRAGEEIKTSLLERPHGSYEGIVAVDWDEDLDEYHVMSEEGYLETCASETINPESVWCLNFVKIEILMLLIFKDDLHRISSREDRKKIDFLAYLGGKNA